MKILICTMYDNAMLDFASIQMPLLKRYCTLNAYDLLEFRGPFDAPLLRKVPEGVSRISWSRFIPILDNLSRYDYILWVDIDTIILHSKKLEDFITADLNADLFVRGKRHNFNTGVYLLKCSDYFRELIYRIIERGQRKGDSYEQNAMQEVVAASRLLVKSTNIQSFVSRTSPAHIIHFPWGSFEDKFPNKISAMKHYAGLSELKG